MKKIIPLLFFITLFLFYLNSDSLIIPSTAIRLRIIANSNREEDQNIKKELKNKITPIIDELMSNAHSSKEAISILNDNKHLFQKIIDENHLDASISIGENYFPPKEYLGFNIPAGYYESMVITIGKGLGDNWWCVMYPPLCLIENEKKDNIDYHFLIKDIINKHQS